MIKNEIIKHKKTFFFDGQMREIALKRV